MFAAAQKFDLMYAVTPLGAAVGNQRARESRSQPKYKAKRRLSQKLVVVAGGLASVTCLLAALGVAFALRQESKLQRDALGLELADTSSPSNWLLVGTDNRDAVDPSDPNYKAFVADGKKVEGKRTDTMMIARVDPELKTIDIISVPRDLYVRHNGRSGRVNSFYTYNNSSMTAAQKETQGRRQLINAIQSSLGVPIHHYVEVDFGGFQSIVDALGGVTIDFEKPARDTHSGLKVGSGPQTLSGSQALAYVRSRYYQEQQPDGQWRTDPTSDIGRTERQRSFAVSVAKSFIDSAKSVNLVSTDRQISVAAENLVFSKSVSFSALADLANTYRSVGPENIRSHSLPVKAVRSASGAQLLVLTEQARGVLMVFRGEAPLGGEAIAILNGTGRAGLAGRVAEQLGAGGFTVSDVGDSPDRVAVTQIRYPTRLKPLAEKLSTWLPSPTTLVEDATSTHLTLVIGQDFNE